MGKTLEAWYCVPPDRDEAVVQVAMAGSGPVWGEVRLDAGRLVVEVFGRSDGEPLLLPADELREVLRLAGETSVARPNQPLQQTAGADKLIERGLLQRLVGGCWEGAFGRQPKESREMNRFIGAMSMLACFGFLAPAFAQDNAFHEAQTQLMQCGQPQFLLVSEVDMKANTLAGFFALEESPVRVRKAAVGMIGRKFKLSDIKVTNARRVAVDEADLPTLKGQMVVLYERKAPLGAAYLGLFQEDTIVISYVPEEE